MLARRQNVLIDKNINIIRRRYNMSVTLYEKLINREEKVSLVGP